MASLTGINGAADLTLLDQGGVDPLPAVVAQAAVEAVIDRGVGAVLALGFASTALQDVIDPDDAAAVADPPSVRLISPATAARSPNRRRRQASTACA